MKAQFRITKDNELIVVYVNSNREKKWYECYNVYDDTFFETTKEYLLECKPAKNNEYVELTSILKRKLDITEIMNRMPKL